jgi:hypothetical protein
MEPGESSPASPAMILIPVVAEVGLQTVLLDVCSGVGHGYLHSILVVCVDLRICGGTQGVSYRSDYLTQPLVIAYGLVIFRLITKYQCYCARMLGVPALNGKVARTPDEAIPVGWTGEAPFFPARRPQLHRRFSNSHLSDVIFFMILHRKPGSCPAEPLLIEGGRIRLPQDSGQKSHMPHNTRWYGFDRILYQFRPNPSANSQFHCISLRLPMPQCPFTMLPLLLCPSPPPVGCQTSPYLTDCEAVLGPVEL